MFVQLVSGSWLIVPDTGMLKKHNEAFFIQMAQPIYRFFTVLTQPGDRKAELLSMSGPTPQSRPRTTQKGLTADKGLITGPLLQLPK